MNSGGFLHTGRGSSLVLVNYDMYCGHTESVDLTSEVVGDGERSLCARVVFSSSEMFLLACAEWSNKSVILDVDAVLPYIRPHAVMNIIKWLRIIK